MIEWIREYKDVLTFLGGGAAVLVTAIWAVYRQLDAKWTAAKAAAAPAPTSPQPIQIFGIPLAEFEASLRKREDDLRQHREQPSANGPDRSAELEREIKDLKEEAEQRRQKIETLNRLMEELKADLVPQSLDSDLFPESLRVRSFVKGRELTVDVLVRKAERIPGIVFGAIWVGGLTFVVVGTGLPWPLGILLFALIFYLGFTRHYIKFNFQKQNLTIVTPGGIMWGRVPTPIKISSIKLVNGWQAEIRCEGHRIARTTTKQTEEEAKAELTPFTRVLNWEIGIPIVAADWLKKALPAP